MNQPGFVYHLLRTDEYRQRHTTDDDANAPVAPGEERAGAGVGAAASAHGWSRPCSPRARNELLDGPGPLVVSWTCLEQLLLNNETFVRAHPRLVLEVSVAHL